MSGLEQNASSFGPRFKLLLYPFIIYIFGASIFSYYRFRAESAEKLREIDHRLLIGANQVKDILPKDFPDRCTSTNSITKGEHRVNMEKLNAFVNSGGFEYFYTIHLIDGELYYSSTSYAEDEDPQDEELAYCYSLKDSEESDYDKILNIFTTEKTEFFNNTDQWGHHRSCMVLATAPGGTKYIIGADYEISYIDTELWKEVPESFLIALIFLVLAIPFIYFINKYWKDFNDELKELNGQLQKDIEYRKKVEGDLRKAKKDAELSYSTQKAFFTNISHEIRTPMNGIVGMSQILYNSGLSEDQKHSVDIIKESGEHLMCVIEDLLRYSRLESVDFNLKVEAVNLRYSVDYCFDILAKNAQVNNVSLRLEDNVIDKVYTDKVRFEQILINLVGNAVKFSKDSEVLLSIDTIDKEDSEKIQIKVIDRGIGIPSDFLEDIFKPFKQVDASHTREYSGSGLGLAITKKLCEMLGGEVSLKSELGKGSTFTVIIQNMESVTSAEYCLANS